MSAAQEHPFVVGITGGVASGKSTVAAMFQALGVPVIDADVASRAVVEPGSEGLAAIVAAFGPDCLDTHGRLDRRRMRELVFADQAARKRLEAILHPRIERHMREAARRMSECDPPPAYIVAAIPLLVEVGAYPWLSRVLVVDVPEAVQIQRVMARDGIDEEAARRMLAAQVGRERRLAVADDVIVNDADLETLRQRVRALDAYYRRPSS